jgi:hypothetical protein
MEESEEEIYDDTYEEVELEYDSSDEEIFEWTPQEYDFDQEVIEENMEESEEEIYDDTYEEVELEYDSSDEEIFEWTPQEYDFDEDTILEEEIIEPDAPKVEVDEMSDVGVLRLKFDQQMNFGDNLPGEKDLEFILDSSEGVYIGKYYPYTEN